MVSGVVEMHGSDLCVELLCSAILTSKLRIDHCFRKLHISILPTRNVNFTFLSRHPNVQLTFLMCKIVISLQDRRIGELGQEMTWARDRAKEGGGGGEIENRFLDFKPPPLPSRDHAPRPCHFSPQLSNPPVLQAKSICEASLTNMSPQ